jgi:TRAP-type mannitol/chloroaromatic compound transport system permease small subunit
MLALLRLARWIDALNDAVGSAAKWAVLASCVISAGNAATRHLLDASSNAWLEIQWYLFAACVMLGAAQVLRLNEHVRVDLIYGRLSARARVWLDLFGLSCFLLPSMAVMLWYAAPLAWRTWVSQEMSNNAGGLIRWPVMVLLPLGFALVGLQGLAELIKRCAWLRGHTQSLPEYERPLQ